jgi:hypothetical protein
VSRISIRKMGTRLGRPHYGVSCIGCPALFGKENILAVAHLDKDTAQELGRQHVNNNHGDTKTWL